MTLHPRPLLLAVALCLGLATALDAQKSSCEFEGVERIVAVGDVHGAFDNLVKILQATGVIDQRQRWSGGKTHLLQLGDVVDRGPDSRKVLDLYRRLEREASSAGGRLHFLMGNHEAMRITGDARYISPGEYKAFVTSGSEVLRSNFLDAVADPEHKKFFASQPLGYLELLAAFGSKGAYGPYLRGLNSVVRINGIVFVHAGINPTVAPMPCGTINDTIRRELTTDVEKTKAEPANTLSLGVDGPLWYRGLALEPEDTFAPQVDDILKGQQAKAIVIAHTPQENGRITPRFGGKVIAIDTGMQTEYVPTGRPSALEVTGGTFTAVYTDGRQPIGSTEARPAAN